jgi:hypothetical protein
MFFALLLSPLFAFVFLAILKPKPDKIRIVLPTPDPMLIEHEPQHVATVLASDGHGCRFFGGCGAASSFDLLPLTSR